MYDVRVSVSYTHPYRPVYVHKIDAATGRHVGSERK